MSSDASAAFIFLLPSPLFAFIIYKLSLGLPVNDENVRFKMLWPASLDNKALLQHFLMVGTTQAIVLNGVMWTLVHEMRISLFFPLIARFARNARLALVTGGILFIGTTAVLLTQMKSADRLVLTDSFAITWIITLRIIPFFIAEMMNRWVELPSIRLSRKLQTAVNSRIY